MSDPTTEATTNPPDDQPNTNTSQKYQLSSSEAEALKEELFSYQAEETTTTTSVKDNTDNNNNNSESHQHSQNDDTNDQKQVTDRVETATDEASGKGINDDATTASSVVKGSGDDSSSVDTQPATGDGKGVNKDVCCASCKNIGGRACICVVPFYKRRNNDIQNEGCVTCRCHGCHPEDRKKRSAKGEQDDHARRMMNGCCKPCMKAFSNNGKACLCQVPRMVRRGPLPPDGCKICKCHGCNPDFEEPQGRQNRDRSQKHHHHHPHGHNQGQKTPLLVTEPVRDVQQTEMFRRVDAYSARIASVLGIPAYMLGVGIPLDPGVTSKECQKKNGWRLENDLEDDIDDALDPEVDE
eukprot:CAMPEP_0115042014 /NCGR_PEP_ID=MMETSP0216-20121206/46014_1 /TAXON_ID=223996 /ORGANISM="Protocruzia adherens, Strain Boccale" /LENGTH=352 /DNA_ID=CAMNT_0002424049 /DNA_START=9 /DNA_END=1068 /DNA_ORIENTATION=-